MCSDTAQASPNPSYVEVPLPDTFMISRVREYHIKHQDLMEAT